LAEVRVHYRHENKQVYLVLLSSYDTEHKSYLCTCSSFAKLYMHICIEACWTDYVWECSLDTTLSSQRAISGRYHQMGTPTRCARRRRIRIRRAITTCASDNAYRQRPGRHQRFTDHLLLLLLRRCSLGDPSPGTAKPGKRIMGKCRG